jgi:hypothetical protein
MPECFISGIQCELQEILAKNIRLLQNGKREPILSSLHGSTPLTMK